MCFGTLGMAILENARSLKVKDGLGYKDQWLDFYVLYILLLQTKLLWRKLGQFQLFRTVVLAKGIPGKIVIWYCRSLTRLYLVSVSIHWRGVFFLSYEIDTLFSYTYLTKISTVTFLPNASYESFTEILPVIVKISPIVSCSLYYYIKIKTVYYQLFEEKNLIWNVLWFVCLFLSGGRST